MVLTKTPICNFGEKAKPFNLKGTDNKIYNLEDLKGEKGTLVMFICNHCPYVKAVITRLLDDARVLQEEGIGVAAIMSNATEQVEADSFENMQIFAEKHGFTFPYLIDETQDVARTYDAVCTPDFFGFNADNALQYRGRIDEAGLKPASEDTPRELLEAMRLIAKTGSGPHEQIASMGCSIKWRTNDN